MKKRLEKKAEKMRRKKIHEILDIVLEINTTERRQAIFTGDKPTAFFDFSGHTSGIRVSINEYGWRSGLGPCPGEKQFNAYANSKRLYRMDDMLAKLKDEKRWLKSMEKM